MGTMEKVHSSLSGPSSRTYRIYLLVYLYDTYQTITINKQQKQAFIFGKHRHHEPHGSTLTTARAARQYPRQHGCGVIHCHFNHLMARFRHRCGWSIKIAAGALIDFLTWASVSDDALADRRCCNRGDMVTMYGRRSSSFQWRHWPAVFLPQSQVASNMSYSRMHTACIHIKFFDTAHNKKRSSHIVDVD